MKKVNKDFPVYVTNEWNTIDPSNFDNLVEIIKRNKKKHKHPQAASFWLVDDDDGTFKKLYDKFFDFIQKEFNLTPTQDNTRICNVYYNTGNDAIEILDPHGRQYYHTHKHVVSASGNATTVAGVYYLNVPDTKSGTIDFKIEEELTEEGFVDVATDMRYHQFNARPYKKFEDIKESRIKEITYQPITGDLVVFPSYLDHRPNRSLKPGHRIAINFELKTLEHPKEIFENYDKKNNL